MANNSINCVVKFRLVALFRRMFQVFINLFYFVLSVVTRFLRRLSFFFSPFYFVDEMTDKRARIFAARMHFVEIPDHEWIRFGYIL